MIKLVNIDCDLCGSRRYKKLYEIGKIDIYTESNKIVTKVTNGVCLNCGFVFQNPRPTRNLLRKFYSDQYRGPTNDEYLQSPRIRIAQSNFILKRLNLKEGKVLDIGSFKGFFLSIFKDAGWEVLGIEPSKKSAKFARHKYSVPTITYSFEKARIKNKSFDLVTINHTLEHVYNPSITLSIINKKLKNGGFLFIEVPNLFRPRIETFADFFSFQHLSNFSPISLDMFLQKTGFKITHKKTNFKYPAMRFLARKVRELPRDSYLPYKINSEVQKATEFFTEYKKEKDKFFKRIRLKIDYAINTSRNGRGLIIFGAGEHSAQLFEKSNIKQASIIGFVDNDKSKQGKHFFGYRVYSPNDLLKLNPNVVLISSYDSQKELFEQITKILPRNSDIVTLYTNIKAYDTLDN